ncbi:MAG: CAP domain-containing protein [Saprospiraceae bacterium]|nr:CAP domain-containing protein [Saprospiraceae bacterium]MCF8250345.1 CAP domain-containing protein [Saprospiraceae bacterium]MCF8280418.1 CAP domain-containing protein [Bacteroidales bacterium]MCF8312153.1 CAP domain-containing protein [Saprospiraceae bacterium]MCF8441883.1 CAP domain-containing protein [Saprospiraceae bacterium]
MLASKIAIAAAFVCSTIWPSTKTTAPAHFDENVKQEMLAQINRLRAKGCKCGNKYMPPAEPIAWNDRLEKAALGHANDMQRKKFFDHKGSNGSTFGARVKKAGYDWWSVGENISWGYDSFEDTLEGWKESPGHCRNLMSRDYSEMGVAKVGAYWVQDFGRQSWKP